MFITRHLKPRGVRQLTRDLTIALISIILAILLVRTGVIHDLVRISRPFELLTEFLAGILFTSTFTTPLAIVTFLELGQEGYNPFLTALIGGVGSVIGDLLLYKFVKDDLSEDLFALAKGFKRTLWGRIFKSKLFYWLTPIIAGLIIASPLPDEIGVSLLGAAKIKTRTFILVSYCLNTVGIMSILIVGTFSQ